MTTAESGSEKYRIDKWLWAARFFKTRALAAEAVSGGKVHVNGERVKPARPVRVGDELRVRRGHEEFVVIVRGLSGRRGPAKEAVELYEETAVSREARERLMEQRRLESLANPQPSGRPDKRSRRRIIRFIGRD